MPFPALAALSWFGTIKSLLAKVPAWVWIALALTAAWYWERDRYADAREAKVRAEEQAAHAVTKASLAALEADMARIVQEGRERAERATQAKERAERDARGLRSSIERLKRADTSDPCRTPREVLEAGV